MDYQTEILQYLISNNREDEFLIESSKCMNWTTHNSFILHDDQTSFISFDIKNSFLQINFSTCSVEVWGYRLSSSFQYYHSYMENWALLGSKDGNEWTALDERVNDNSLGKEGIIDFHIFPQGYFKFIKIVQIKENSKLNNVLSLRYFDIIGKIK